VNSTKQHWLTQKDKASSLETPNHGKPHKHRKPLWVVTLPVLFLVSLVAVFTYAFRDRLMPGIPVTFVTAVAIPHANLTDTNGATRSSNTSNQMLFQATGWIEPDPLPIRVTPLYSGVVREVHLLEGQTVNQGQTIVSLVDDDAKLAMRRAEAELAQAKAAEASLQAKLNLVQTRQETASRQHESEWAQLAEYVDATNRLRALKPGTMPERDLVQAQLREKRQSANVAAAAATIEEWKAEAELTKKQIEVQLQLITSAEVARDEASLALSRTRVVAPVDGVILRLLATPGKRLMLTMDHPDSATAAILYEPDKLQARVDVPLADAGKLTIGQIVRVSCSLLPDKEFTGSVTRIVGEADLQRNTLQAKVRIEKPDTRLRPEMLCRAEFYRAPSEDRSGTSEAIASGPLTVFAPSTAVAERSGQIAKIWVVTTDNRHAEWRDVKIGTNENDGDLPILEGIRPGDRMIINPPSTLKVGARIKLRKASPENISR
jgi:HlyD family secretion protein